MLFDVPGWETLMSKLKRLNIMTAIWASVTLTGFLVMGREYIDNGLGFLVNFVWFVAMMVFA